MPFEIVAATSVYGPGFWIGGTLVLVANYAIGYLMMRYAPKIVDNTVGPWLWREWNITIVQTIGFLLWIWPIALLLYPVFDEWLR